MPKTVLIIDDDPLALRLLGRTVSDAGYHVVTATGVQEAERAIETFEPSLLVLDWNLALTSSADLCRRIRTFEPLDYVYVLALTAEDGGGRGSDPLASGADDFLTRPVAAAELLARLRIGARVVDLTRRLAIHDDAPPRPAAAPPPRRLTEVWSAPALPLAA